MAYLLSSDEQEEFVTKLDAALQRAVTRDFPESKFTYELVRDRPPQRDGELGEMDRQSLTDEMFAAQLQHYRGKISVGVRIFYPPGYAEKNDMRIMGHPITMHVRTALFTLGFSEITGMLDVYDDHIWFDVPMTTKTLQHLPPAKEYDFKD